MSGRVLQDIHKERDRQDSMWGEQNHSPIEWLAILGEEYGEACKGAIKVLNYSNEDYYEYRDELIHIAATAVAAVESLDRQEDKNE